MTLDARLECFFAMRLTQTMGSAFHVRFHDDTDSPVPALLADLSRGRRRRLVPVSQGLTEYLHEVQTASNPEGLLVVLIGSMEQYDVVAVMKLEHESGVRSELVERGGSRTFRIHIENELFLTTNTKVFKAGLFRIKAPRPNEIAPNDLDAWVSDDRASQGGTPVARFFRERFLACHFYESPELHTQDYYEVSERWVNTVEDPERRVRYTNALLAELNSNRRRVDPRAFARDNLETEDQSRYLDSLLLSGVGRAAFQKDTARVSSRLRRTSIDTEHGVQIVAETDLFDQEIVRVERGDDGAPDRVEVTDRIRRDHGR